ncbi:esterase-like activity of phytase family protein [Massilia sp. S19_KUP03_FR1]|uniref:esterase-like activity of phytase family protein n=1 Tax=Massilia sp. S19_KUP03_FR1 TaxID=3025503 RepID=UPI002FCCE6E4
MTPSRFTTLRFAILSLASAVLLGGCAQLPPARSAADTISQLRLIGEQRLPHRPVFNGTIVGGLSGIDYDPVHGDWVMISDDRSEQNPARYYRARLRYDDKAFTAIELTSVHTMLQPDGSPYPSSKQYPARAGVVPDLEAVRIDPQDGSLWYTSEGDVKLGLHPFVRRAAPDGRYLAELPLPPLFKVDQAKRSGPRDNQAFEGLSFAPDGKTLWVSLEGPLYQDGDVPDTARGAVNRITHFARDGKVLGQYVYPLGVLPAAPGKGKNADIGIAELLAIGPSRLLALERAGIENDAGVYTTYVRIYEIDTAGATDVSSLPTLAGASYRPAAKRLVLDLNAIGLPTVDNLEGMAFGPVLPNGHASLVLISDDNFSKKQVTQVLVFDVIP